MPVSAHRAAETTLARWARTVAALGLLSSCHYGGTGPGASPQRSEIALASPGVIEAPARPPATASGPALQDADVEQLATRLPRAQVPLASAQNPSRGPLSAPVVLQIWSDFQCPFCAQVAPELARVERRFAEQLRVVWRNYPLPFHAYARPAARAALEAKAEGGNDKFWQLHDWLFSEDGDLSEPGLVRGARALGLDPVRVEQALHGTMYEPLIEADVAAGNAAGVNGTPAVLVNDYCLIGARSADEYAVVIERALREASAH